MRYVIGIDLGTTNIKAILFDERGRLVAEASERQALMFPEPGFVEQDPSAWYEVPCALIRTLLGRSEIDPNQVCAIGISSQGISVLPVNAEYRPLSNAISWLDTRAKPQLDELLRACSRQALVQLTGKRASESYTLPKLMWLKQNRPAVFDAARYLLMPMDYLAARLTGRALTDPTMAGGTMLYALQKGAWSEELAQISGIPLDKLPEIGQCGSIAGMLNRGSAGLTGLPEGVPVAIGAQDQKAAAYGARLKPGMATLCLGTAAALMGLVQQPGGKLPIFPFVDGDLVVEACVNTAGAAIEWARDVLLRVDGYDEIDALAKASPCGSNGVVFRPLLSGGGTHYAADVDGRMEGLSLGSTRADIARSIYEGIACEVALGVEDIRASGGCVRTICAFGGGANSALLCQIIADVCDLELYTYDVCELAALGAARLAARAVGLDAQAFGSMRIEASFAPKGAKQGRQVYKCYTKGG